DYYCQSYDSHSMLF
nr:immunoglobulin light chain junction region [Macaca mulatta]MOX16984.1 immunoglobulin light chain junction region [Macaca mulatta]MOX17269.1 immunoglobulin light chain junction region [Macaca mulatta]MOX17290.1 immunoglobulin light chain junction region [Macaca mulatta]MOX17560.1 immunoglobulin light chain junction region [Macaca mulatta]